jgi:hypothetical protein
VVAEELSALAVDDVDISVVQPQMGDAVAGILLRDR